MTRKVINHHERLTGRARTYAGAREGGKAGASVKAGDVSGEGPAGSDTAGSAETESDGEDAATSETESTATGSDMAGGDSEGTGSFSGGEGSSAETGSGSASARPLGSARSPPPGPPSEGAEALISSPTPEMGRTWPATSEEGPALKLTSEKRAAASTGSATAGAPESSAESCEALNGSRPPGFRV